MTYTLDVRGDTTYVVAGDRPVAMVQPDRYHPGRDQWSSWRRTGGQLDTYGGWEWQADHPTREQALAAVGYHERSV